MIPRTDVTDVGRLYDKALADNALVEIELDTQQLRAITDEEVQHLLDAAGTHSWDTIVSDDYTDDPQFNKSLEALLRLSWPVWKATS